MWKPTVSREYALTALGREVADLAQNDIAAFCDQLAAAIYEAHSYFRALIGKLQVAPIACPEVSESEIETPPVAKVTERTIGPNI